jgi:integrase
MQEFTNKVLALTAAQKESENHVFSDYAWNWYHTYSAPNVESSTATTYKRQLTLHLIPFFGDMSIEDITTDDVQRFFNSMSGAKATKNKAKEVLNQVLETAIEDGFIQKNPLKSKRLKITGKASKPTVPYSVEQMRYLVQHIEDIESPVDRAYLALQALHPLRLEEVLGLHSEDIDTKRMEIHIRRAVTHPTRNQPEIKDTKTDSSYRTIGLSSLALPFLLTAPTGKFIFGGDNPLSYTQVRRMCNRIKRDTGFSENITPIRFRTTVLTDLYDQTKDIKLTQAAAGHTTSAMTLKYYVKGRETNASAVSAVDRTYSA